MSRASAHRPHGWAASLLAGTHGWVAVLREGPSLIEGAGATAEAALADAADSTRGPFRALPASAELIARVTARGGDVGWQRADGAAILEGELSLQDWSDEVAAGMAVPTAAADWADLRREMLARMARAAALGSPAVRLTPRSRVVWAVAPGERGDGQLSDRPLSAAEEVQARLGDGAFVERLEVARRNALHARREALRQLGVALYGAEWVSPLARLSGISLRTVQRWASADRDEAPSESALADIRRLAAPVAAEVRAELRGRIAVLDAVISGR